MKRRIPCATDAEAARLDAVVQRARVVVCVGPGGVGKTTVAAAVGVHAAREGRRALVLTIDPAKRLATALGLADGAPRRVPAELFERAGTSPRGSLEAEMVDTGAVLDALVERHAPDAAAAARIRGHPFYRRLGQALSGLQTYAAMERLDEVLREGDHDLVVLDTPPSATALHFLDAPRRLVGFLESAVWRSLAGAGGEDFWTARIVRRLARFTGSDVFEGLGELMGELAAMRGGFERRARRVAATLQSEHCAFLVVVRPTALAIEEALHFRGRLEHAGFHFASFVVNGVQPRFGEPEGGALALRLRSRIAGEPVAESAIDELAATLRRIVAEAATLARREDESLAPLRAGTSCVDVPRLVPDVHDLGGLARMARHLFSANAADPDAGH
jgi:anion-transporting  ArsA/GET3 family ATPase